MWCGWLVAIRCVLLWSALSFAVLGLGGESASAGGKRTRGGDSQKSAGHRTDSATHCVSIQTPGAGREVSCGRSAAAVVSGRGGRGPQVLWAPPAGPEQAVIVLFHGPALSASGRGASQAAVSTHRRSLERQRAKLRGALAPGRKLRRSFEKVLNAAALEVDRAELARVRALPDVREVFPDREVTARLDGSRLEIRADLVESELGASGAGRTIAIVDTGIDYTHPDLGAGFGPGFKVVGGRDFVNDDADPFDDNGHGTHVAGIAAANGGLRGIAPEAALLAVKVLDENGSGRESDVIAGIEYAVDPDGDRSTRDGADVINLSLGASDGYPDDPLSQAADAATEAGVVVVAAAGNTGGYFSIESPGASRKAITVGASDGADSLASFSSRGPSRFPFSIKPDLLAPGVSIVSTVPTGSCRHCFPSGRRPLSGTSMAAPHVAGAAALLLELEPDLLPSQVKATLMNHASELEEDVYSQGSGLVDSFAAAAGEATARAPSQSLRVDDGSQQTFTAVRQVEIENRSDSTMRFDLSLDGLDQPGIAAGVLPASLTLPAKGVGRARILIVADNDVLPDGAREPYHYEGDLRIGSPSTRMHVPIAFIKSPLLVMNFDEKPWFALVHDRTSEQALFTTSRKFIVRPLPRGSYDVHVTFPPSASALREVVREDVTLEGITALKIGAGDAIHRLQASIPVDPDVYRRSGSIHVLKHRATDFGSATVRFGGPPPELHFSDVGPDYDLQWQLQATASGRPGYSGLFALSDGIGADIAFTPGLADFAELRFDLGSVDDHGPLFVLDRICGWSNPNSLICAGSFSGNDPPVPMSRVESEFLMPTPAGFGLGYLMKEPWSYHGTPFELGGRGEIPLVSSGLVAATSSGSAIQLHAQLGDPDPREPQLEIEAGASIPIGRGPLHWVGQFVNSPRLIRILPRSWLGHTSLFDTQIGDIRWSAPPHFELLESGEVIRTGGLPADIPVTEGRYTLRAVLEDYPIAGELGSALVEASFDTRLADPDPPFLRSLQLLSNGSPTDILRRGDSNELVVDAHDAVCLSSVQAWLGEEPGLRHLQLAHEGDRYRAKLSPYGTRRRIALRVLASDCSGNELRLDLHPGFLQETQPGRRRGQSRDRVKESRK